MIRYWLWRISNFIWQKLPLRIGYTCACLIADITYLAWPRGRTYARENMAYVLGDSADRRTIERTARQSLRNYFKYLVDFIRFPLLNRDDIEEMISFGGWENLDRAFQQGKGVIFVGLHFGNWDLAAAAVVQHNYPLNVITESFASKKLDDLVQGTRSKLGMKAIPMEGALIRIVHALKRNEMLALLIDQPSPGDGVAVNFFDAPVQVPAGAAALALRTGASVIPGGMVRLPDNTFLGFTDSYIQFQPSGDFEKDVQMLTQRIMSSLEARVRQYPDQWYMFRRMWVPC